MIAYKAVLIIFMTIALSISQEMRTLLLSKKDDTTYHCLDLSCAPSTNISVQNLRRCEMASISNANCRTVTFDQSNNNCQVFFNSPSEYGNMLAQTGVTTMFAIDSRQSFYDK
jgi:hypothetical protein